MSKRFLQSVVAEARPSVAVLRALAPRFTGRLARAHVAVYLNDLSYLNP